MSSTIKIALIQQHATRDQQENLKRGVIHYEQAASAGANLIVYPELAFSWFHPQQPAAGRLDELMEPIPGPTSDLFSRLAKKWGVVTVLNLYENREDRGFDASPVIDANGDLLGTTRMVHICDTPCFHEQGYYTPGEGYPLVFDTAVGRIGIAICYDRHYPEYMRMLSLLGADLVVIPQAGGLDEWPEGLFEAEVRVAAFQNGYFAALCNRVGAEDCITFEGNSFVVSPDGQLIAQAPKNEDAVLITDINLDQVKQSHAARHFLRDRRPDIYRRWREQIGDHTF